MIVAALSGRVMRLILVGAAVGFVTLGLVGRIAMFGFAEFTDRPTAWTLTGTVNVGLAGAIAGAIAAVLYVLIERWFLPRAPTIVRGLAFGALVFLVASPGIRPPWLLTFALFTPAFLLYGVMFVAIVVRFSKREPVVAAPGNTEVT